jgi:ElaB/YqjD/DUF883 family membrane-anchored ribosome-binding protein
MAVKPAAGAKSEEGGDEADLARQINELRADLERLTASLGDLAQGKAAGLLDALQSRMHAISGNAEAMVKDKVAGVEAKLDGVTDYARRKPLQALAMAAGAGMLFGMLFGRR